MLLLPSSLDRIRRIQAREFARDRSALDRLWLASAGDRSYTFDANMGLADGAAPQTASGYSQYAGADGIIDLGGNQGAIVTLPSIADVTTITPQQPRIDAVCCIDITALNTGSTNLYKFILVGSNDPAFGATAGSWMLGMIEVGAAASLDQVNGIITPAVPAIGGSRYELLFTNEQNNVKYQYLKLYVKITGGGTLTTTFKAGVYVLPEP